MKVKKDVLVALGAVGALALVLGIIKGVQIYIAMSNQFMPPPITVTSLVVTENTWNKTFDAVGSIAATQGTMLSAELAGKVKRINFTSGQEVAADSILVELDTEYEKAALKGAEALAFQSLQAFERAKTLRAKNANSVSDYEMAQMKASEGQSAVDTLKAQIKKKEVVAPFNGRTGIRLVNEGDYVKEGQELVPFYALDPLFVNFSLPQSAIGNLQTGLSVSIITDAYANEKFEGVVTAIDPEVDPLTREIDVQATVRNSNFKLRPGMFAQVSLSFKDEERVIAVPSSSINFAPYGDTIFVIENMKGQANGAPDYLGVRQQIVKLGSRRGDQIAVLSGLKSGDKIVTSGVFQLNPGAAVVESNVVTPGNDPNPQPKDT